jgi:2-polyprenyl-3-methyl-5-hydroxy-6-metoxy-1,4-benzoquinol methylase
VSTRDATTDYSGIYDPEADFDSRYTRATVARIAPHVLPGERVLELGCATGLMTAELAARAARVTAVDRSEAYLDRARRRGLPGVRFVEARLEDAGWEEEVGPGFDHVLACNLIHELPDPLDALTRAAGLLGAGGVMHVSVQNPRSIHRLVAMEMGLIDDASDISGRGHRYATLRIWDVDQLIELAWDAGLRVVAREGVMLKPLPNDMMAALPEDVLDGFERAARHLPDNCAMTYLVLRAR